MARLLFCFLFLLLLYCVYSIFISTFHHQFLCCFLPLPLPLLHQPYQIFMLHKCVKFLVLYVRNSNSNRGLSSKKIKKQIFFYNIFFFLFYLYVYFILFFRKLVRGYEGLRTLFSSLIPSLKKKKEEIFVFLWNHVPKKIFYSRITDAKRFSCAIVEIQFCVC